MLADGSRIRGSGVPGFKAVELRLDDSSALVQVGHAAAYEQHFLDPPETLCASSLLVLYDCAVSGSQTTVASSACYFLEGRLHWGVRCTRPCQSVGTI
jgi:hypothetical protein